MIPITLTLSPQNATAVFPTLNVRQMPGGWNRCFARLGPLGVRFYFNERSPGVFECALWLANAHAGVGVVDWTQISVGMGSQSFTIGSGSECHPTRRGFVRRFIVNGPQSLLDAPWATIPDPVINFGPLLARQPHVNRAAYKTLAENSLVDLRLAVGMGGMWSPNFPGLDEECGIMHPAMGAWQPLGPWSPGNPGGGNPGGSDIRFQPGYDQTVPGAVLERTRMDKIIERSLHAWSGTTGDYLTVETFGDPGPQYSGSRTPGTTDGELPGFQMPGTQGSACAYLGALEAVGAYDAAHLERAINPAMVAWEYLRDPVAADFLVDLAEEMRLQFSNLGPVQTGPGWQPRNLRNYLALAQAQPHHGGDCGRYRGVPAWCVAMADKVKHRRPYHDWMTMWCQWADTVQMPNGLWQWSANDPQFHNPPGVAAAQCFEQLYVCFARAACGLRMHGDITPILRAVDALFVNRKLARQPYVWNTNQYGPPHFIAVGDANTVTPYNVVSNGWSADLNVAIGDPTNVDHAIALAWHVSGGNEKYKRALLSYGFPADTMAHKLAGYMGSLDMNWSAAAAASIQQATAQGAP